MECFLFSMNHSSSRDLQDVQEDDVEVNDECSSEDEGGHESDQEVVVTNGGGLHKKPGTNDAGLGEYSLSCAQWF